MKKLLPLLGLALACNTVNTLLVPEAPASPAARTPPPALTAPTPASPETAPPPAASATPPAEGSGPTAAAPGQPSRLRPEDVTFHPGPQLYSGDVVSFALKAAAEEDPEWQQARVKVYLGPPAGTPLAVEGFGSFGISGRLQATFWWAWDTSGLEGEQTLTFVVEPAGGGQPLDTLAVPVRLLPADQRPMPERLAQWAQAESECCLFHYLTGTAAARDIDRIKSGADSAFAQVESVLGVQRREKVSFTLLSRLLGHGGFATDEISLTYVDRNPAGLDLPTVFAHEGTHILDRQIGDTRPVLMTEGLAVFVAGGHYKMEDLDRRAAALVRLGHYLPLAELANDFYHSQHEIGYLEAGALIQYLVDRYGWEKFRAMYASFQPAPSEARMLEAGLAAHYGKSLTELEAEWLAHLRGLPEDPGQMDDLRLTIELFDTLRRYQQRHDPAAYFLTAWLPDGPQARQRGIVADFVRSPRAPENIALEAMLAAAEQALLHGEYTRAEALLNSVNAVLDADNLFFDPLAARYLQAVNALAAQGYEAQTIDLSGTTAHATAIRDWPALEQVSLYNSDR